MAFTADYRFQLFILTLGNLANGLFVAEIYPFASLMVMDYGLTDVRSSTGYFSGFLGAAFMLGRGISAPFWGSYIDNQGRRPAIILSLTSLFLGSVVFGCSFNFTFAVGVRFLTGLFTPYSGVCKAAVSELSPREKQPYCMSIFSVGWYLGLVTGSAVGGFLVYPEVTGFFSSSFLAKFPILLPNLVSATVSLIALVLAVLYFTETRTSDSKEDLTKSVWEGPSVKRVLCLFSLQSVSQALFAEVLPLWCWAESSTGGLHYEVDQIGLILTCSYLAIIVTQRPYYEKLVTLKGIRWVLKISLALMIPIVVLTPLQTMYSSNLSALWFSLVLSCNLYNLTNFHIFNAQYLIINNSVDELRRGKLNGIAMSIGSFSKAVGPFIGGSLFASTSSSGWGYPFNFTFVFNLLGVLSVVQLILARELSSEVEGSTEMLELAKPRTLL